MNKCKTTDAAMLFQGYPYNIFNFNIYILFT